MFHDILTQLLYIIYSHVKLYKRLSVCKMASAKQVKLKKLMKEQIQSRKKVEHPLARYV